LRLAVGVQDKQEKLDIGSWQKELLPRLAKQQK
jgi:hypothetical protein